MGARQTTTGHPPTPAPTIDQLNRIRKLILIYARRWVHNSELIWLNYNTLFAHSTYGIIIIVNRRAHTHFSPTVICIIATLTPSTHLFIIRVTPPMVATNSLRTWDTNRILCATKLTCDLPRIWANLNMFLCRHLLYFVSKLEIQNTIKSTFYILFSNLLNICIY